MSNPPQLAVGPIRGLEGMLKEAKDLESTGARFLSFNLHHEDMPNEDYWEQYGGVYTVVTMTHGGRPVYQRVASPQRLVHWSPKHGKSGDWVLCKEIGTMPAATCEADVSSLEPLVGGWKLVPCKSPWMPRDLVFAPALAWLLISQMEAYHRQAALIKEIAELTLAPHPTAAFLSAIIEN